MKNPAMILPGQAGAAAAFPGTSISVAKKRHRILMSMSSFEQKSCSVELPAEVGEVAEVAWFDGTLASTSEWNRLLMDFRPTILVSGWATPPVTEEYLNEPGCKLEYVCHIFGSVRALIPRSFIERGLIVSNWGDVAAAQVAEQALLLALGALRNVRGWESYMRQPVLHRGPQASALGTRTLFGKKVGLHGFGRVARELVKLLAPFQVTLSCYSAGVPEAIFHPHGVKPLSSLRDVFAQNDIVFECEALTPETFRTVDASILAALPDGAVFVNVGRGLLVDEAALLKEVASGRIQIALDVAAEEPLTAQSPLMQIPGALLSPHIGGPTFERFPDCGRAAIDNVLRYLAGESLPSTLSLLDYDRST